MFAFMAIVPSILNGFRNHIWISRAAVLCAVLCVVNFFVYRRFTVRLRKLALLGIAPNQLPDPTLSSGTSPAGQEPRLR